MAINPRSVVCRCVVVGAIATALVTLASAQTGNIRSITFVSVKPDRVGDFQAELKEVHALMKKDNSTRYSSVWMSLTGPREYAIVTYYNKWSELDEVVGTGCWRRPEHEGGCSRPGEAANVAGRLRGKHASNY
jgi:hypothetical protein